MKKYILSIFFCSILTSVFSQLLITDPFTNLNGGVGFSTPTWSGGTISTTTPLLNGTSGYISISSATINRLANGIPNPISAPTWVSFLVRSESASEAYIKFYTNSNGYAISTNVRCYNGNCGSTCGGGVSTNSLSLGKFSSGWGVKYDETGNSGGGCSASSPSDANSTSFNPANSANGQAVLVVMEISNSNLNVYFNPSGVATPPASPHVSLGKPSPNFISSLLINAINLVATGGVASFDELRVGTNFLSVIPIVAPKDYIEPIHAINGLTSDTDIKTIGLVVSGGAPAVGKVLTATDATGNATWASLPASVASQWTTNGTGINYMNKLGIGVANSTTHILSLPAGNANLSIRNNIFINGEGSTGRIANNTYLSNGSLVIADATAKATTIEIRDNGIIEIYGTVTTGVADWRQMFGIDAPNNKVYFPRANVGIGTTNPTSKLHIENGSIRITAPNWTDWLSLNKSDGTRWGIHNPQSLDRITYYYVDAANNPTWDILAIKNNGNIGIGIGNPQNKLDVCGTIRAKEIKVETGWCDYVFEDNYDLMSLDSVSKFILKNKHLPNIPSAIEVQDNPKIYRCYLWHYY